MSEPQPIELAALEQAGPLLKFAAETVKEVPAPLVLTIASSWEARDTKQWAPQIASNFWVAYNSLCGLIKPVSLDTLSSNQPSISKRTILFWREPEKMSLSKITVRNYLNILLVCLFVAIFLQFIVSTATTLSGDVDKILERSDQLVEKIGPELRVLIGVEERQQALVGQTEEDKKLRTTLADDKKKALANINDAFKSIWYGLDKIGTKLTLFSYLTLPGAIESYDPQQFVEFDASDAIRDRMTRYYTDRTFIISLQEKGNFVVKIFNFVLLPLLLGVIGAAAYVTRLISDQIKDSTFSGTSPVRHRIRVALGGLAGVIVGFGWVGGGVSLSPLALAFAAGYAIEPVFATVDAIAEKFRK